MNKPSLLERSLLPLLERLKKGDRATSTIVDLATLVANADGHIDADEYRALGKSLELLLATELSGEVIGHVVASSLRDLEKSGIEVRSWELGQKLRERGVGPEGIAFALSIALVSDGLSASERAVIDKVASAAGVPAEYVSTLVTQLEKDLAEQA